MKAELKVEEFGIQAQLGVKEFGNNAEAKLEVRVFVATELFHMLYKMA
jgi:hypothetical protein